MLEKQRRSKTFLIYTPEYAKDLSNLKVFAIYPDYWGETIRHKGKHNWGEVPCLGYVKEQNEYWAEYAAYTAGIVHYNATFNPRAVEVKTKVADSIQHPINRRHHGRQRNFGK